MLACGSCLTGGERGCGPSSSWWKGSMCSRACPSVLVVHLAPGRSPVAAIWLSWASGWSLHSAPALDLPRSGQVVLLPSLQHVGLRSLVPQVVLFLCGATCALFVR